MIRNISRQQGPVCGVFAATLATPDMPFILVKNMAREEMGNKARWSGPMYMPALVRLLNRLRVSFSRVDLCEVSLRKAAKELNPAKHYIMFVTGHFMTLRNGLGYDQGHPEGVPISEFWCAGRNVMQILEIDTTSPALTVAEYLSED